MTYQEISEKYNIPMSVLTRRVAVLKIKGLFIGRKVSFNSYQVKQIVNYVAKTKINGKIATEKWQTQRKKITIIEFYLKKRSSRQVSRILNLPRPLCDYTIKEYNEKGYVIVGSKMNNE